VIPVMYWLEYRFSLAPKYIFSKFRKAQPEPVINKSNR